MRSGGLSSNHQLSSGNVYIGSICKLKDTVGYYLCCFCIESQQTATTLRHLFARFRTGLFTFTFCTPFGLSGAGPSPGSFQLGGFAILRRA